ncbi:MAG TPA: Rieske (2Fe-2S) protein [Stellaceae bacterium]|nr:Rieske (2Fe-2S) protein [Stellaceae bacterium]
MDEQHRAAAIRLCRIEEIPDGTARGFSFGSGIDREEIFVYRNGDMILGYENACPHQGTPLNFLPNRFLDSEGEHFLCTTHGALFRIATGFCLMGPCQGKSLNVIALRVEDGTVFWIRT